MRPTKLLTLLGFGLCFLLNSCVGGKYRYQFDTGKNLDFSQGKWLLNDSRSNAVPRYDKQLYQRSYDAFEEILGDS